MPRSPLSPPASPKEEASTAAPAQPKGGASSWGWELLPSFLSLSLHCTALSLEARESLGTPSA